MVTDNCPISTNGLLALYTLLKQHDPNRQAQDAVLKVQREQALIDERLRAAFGQNVGERVSSLALVER